MIGKVSRGSDVGGLLRYVFGPGRHDEHTDQHVVAGWIPDAADLAPPTAAGGHDLRTLAAELSEPLTVAGRPGQRSVWHCALRTAPEDPRLSDEQWADVACTVMARTGLDTGDGAGVRWVAVRHAEDHVHIVATLARRDGRRAQARNDYYRVGEACHEVEARYGLRSTAPSDRTAGKQATRAEVEKARRGGRREPARAVLRREVRAAVAGASSPDDFVHDLERRGVMVRLRCSTKDESQVTGYAVALPEDRVGTSPPAWFGGSKLAPELSWNRLAATWDADCPGVNPSWRQLSAELRRLDLRRGGADEALGLAAVAALDSMGGRSARRRQVDDDIARACRRAWGASRSLDGAHARVLGAARGLTCARPGHPDVAQAIREIARLLDALARLRRAQHRTAQAQAALAAAHTLRDTVPSTTAPAARSHAPAPRPTRRRR